MAVVLGHCNQPLQGSLTDVASAYHRGQILIGHLHVNLGSHPPGRVCVRRPPRRIPGILGAFVLPPITLSWPSVLLAQLLIKPDASALRPAAGACLPCPIYSSSCHQIPRNGCHSSRPCARQALPRSPLVSMLSRTSGRLGLRVSRPGSGWLGGLAPRGPDQRQRRTFECRAVRQTIASRRPAPAIRAVCLSHRPPARRARSAPHMPARGPVPGPQGLERPGPARNGLGRVRRPALAPAVPNLRGLIAPICLARPREVCGPKGLVKRTGGVCEGEGASQRRTSPRRRSRRSGF